MRSEAKIFADLTRLCTSPGYVYALALIHLENELIRYKDKLTPDHLLPSYSFSRLIRSELSLLLGLMIKEPVDFTFQENEVTADYAAQSEELLEELHAAIDQPSKKQLQGLLHSGTPDSAGFDQLMRHGAFLREAMFYGAESAFTFQYLDLAREKYAADAEWLSNIKGFTIDEAHALFAAILKLQPDRIMSVQREASKSKDMRLGLAALTLSLAEIAKASALAPSTVNAVLDAFSLAVDERNPGFQSASDFNRAASTPILRLPNGRIANFHSMSLCVALYETPFYWIASDKPYFNSRGQANRGEFAEAFCTRRLRRVFGDDRVHSNVFLKNLRGDILGEIDVLVIYGDRGLLFQVKSKRLRLDAQKGIESLIYEDFQKGVQKAYDQGFDCAELLSSRDCIAENSSGAPIQGLDQLASYNIVCVLSDHYPALAHQARHLIETRALTGVGNPYITDIFMIDELTEMLESPLRFLSYIDRRTGYDDRVLASNEHVLFGYHLKKNLWLDPGTDTMQMSDDVAVELDIAMLARRTGVKGAKTPKGLLTDSAGTPLNRLIKIIDDTQDPIAIKLGLLLLTLSGESSDQLNQGIEKIVRSARRDQKSHDFSMSLQDASEGLTFHCSNRSTEDARERLLDHCVRRKYLDKKDQWFGIWLGPGTFEIRLVVFLNYPWVEDVQVLEAIHKKQPAPYPADKITLGVV